MGSYSRPYVVDGTLASVKLVIDVHGKLHKELERKYGHPGHMLDEFRRDIFEQLHQIQDAVDTSTAIRTVRPGQTFGREASLTLDNSVVVRVQVHLTLVYAPSNGDKLDNRLADCTAFVIDQFKPYLDHLNGNNNDDDDPHGARATVSFITERLRRKKRPALRLATSNGDTIA